MSSPFALTRGTSQRRIAVTDAPDGDFVFELGHSNRVDARLAVGDYHEVKQDFVRPAQAAFITPKIQISHKDFTGLWDVVVRLNGVVVYQRRLITGVPDYTLNDIKISLAAAIAAPATNEISFRLGLVG